MWVTNIHHYEYRLAVTTYEHNTCTNMHAQYRTYYLTFVTGPAKIGNVGTNYIPLHNISYLSTGVE